MNRKLFVMTLVAVLCFAVSMILIIFENAELHRENAELYQKLNECTLKQKAEMHDTK